MQINKYPAHKALLELDQWIPRNVTTAKESKNPFNNIAKCRIALPQVIFRQHPWVT